MIETRHAPGGGRPARRGFVLVVVGVAAVAAAVLLAPSGVGTVAPERPIAVRILSVRFLSGISLAVADLERGAVSVHPPHAHGLSREPVSGASLTDDGLVVWQADDRVRVFTGDDLSEPALVHTPADLTSSTPAGAAPSISPMPTVDGGALWVIQVGACCADPRPGRAELVELSSGEVLQSTELPPSSTPVAAVPGSLLLNHVRHVEAGDGWRDEPGSHRVLLLAEDGGVRELSPGRAIAATDRSAAVLACGAHRPRGDCRLDLVDLVSGEHDPVTAPARGTWNSVAASNVPTNTPPWAAAARHGRILVGLAGEETDPDDPSVRRQRLVVIDTTGRAGPTARVAFETEAKGLAAAWDEHGEHAVVATVDDSDVTVINVADGSSFLVRDVVPPDHQLLGMH